MQNEVQLLKKGDYATFRDNYGYIVLRKVKSVYKHFNGVYSYNVGNGCNGDSFRNEDIITKGEKVNR